MPALYIALAYLAVGAVVAFKTYEPEQGGWVWAVLIWPLVLLSIWTQR